MISWSGGDLVYNPQVHMCLFNPELGRASPKILFMPQSAVVASDIQGREPTPTYFEI
jgi:hypothetical protein